MNLQVGQRIRFIEEKRAYTIQAVSATGRYVVCTKLFFGTVMYSIFDVVAGVRGVDDSIGNSLGYETRQACENAADLFETGMFGFSKRHRPIPAVIVLSARDARYEASRQRLGAEFRAFNAEGRQ